MKTKTNPSGSYVYSNNAIYNYTTPMGSHLVFNVHFYKHKIPSGLHNTKMNITDSNVNDNNAFCSYTPSLRPYPRNLIYFYTWNLAGITWYNKEPSGFKCL